MSFDLERIIKTNGPFAAISPIAQKLRMLDALRERTLSPSGCIGV